MMRQVPGLKGWERFDGVEEWCWEIAAERRTIQRQIQRDRDGLTSITPRRETAPDDSGRYVLRLGNHAGVISRG